MDSRGVVLSFFVHFINYFDSVPLLRATYDIEFRKPAPGGKGEKKSYG